MLTVTDLSCGYGRTDILRHISLEAPNGSFFCVAGPNGCGKTTLLRALVSLLPHSGSVRLDGKEVSGMKRREIARKIAVLTQFTGASFPYTVHETVFAGRYAHRTGVFSSPGEEDREMVRDCLCACDLLGIADRPVTELSGGQLQRVFLAKALAQDPEVILLDEPTNHLDVTHQIVLMEYLKAWAKEKNRTVVGVMHDLSLTLRLADRALLLCAGEAVAQGTCREVFTDGNLKDAYGADIRAWMLHALRQWEALG